MYQSARQSYPEIRADRDSDKNRRFGVSLACHCAGICWGYVAREGFAHGGTGVHAIGKNRKIPVAKAAGNRRSCPCASLCPPRPLPLCLARSFSLTGVTIDFPRGHPAAEGTIACLCVMLYRQSRLFAHQFHLYFTFELRSCAAHRPLQRRDALARNRSNSQ